MEIGEASCKNEDNQLVYRRDAGNFFEYLIN